MLQNLDFVLLGAPKPRTSRFLAQKPLTAMAGRDEPLKGVHGDSNVPAGLTTCVLIVRAAITALQRPVGRMTGPFRPKRFRATALWYARDSAPPALHSVVGDYLFPRGGRNYSPTMTCGGRRAGKLEGLLARLPANMAISRGRRGEKPSTPLSTTRLRRPAGDGSHLLGGACWDRTPARIRAVDAWGSPSAAMCRSITYRVSVSTPIDANPHDLSSLALNRP